LHFLLSKDKTPAPDSCLAGENKFAKNGVWEGGKTPTPSPSVSCPFILRAKKCSASAKRLIS